MCSLTPGVTIRIWHELAGENLICRNWTFSKREQSLQSLIRVIFADSNDIWNVVHCRVFFNFFQFWTIKSEFDQYFMIMKKTFGFDRVIAEILGGQANSDLIVQNWKKLKNTLQCTTFHISLESAKITLINDCKDCSRLDNVQFRQINFSPPLSKDSNFLNRPKDSFRVCRRPKVRFDISIVKTTCKYL